MFYNIIFIFTHIFGAKVGIFFHIHKFICIFLQNCANSCIIQFFVVTLHPNL